MEAYKRSGCKAPFLLILGTRWSRVVKLSFNPPYPREVTFVSTKQGE
jgi:hypothetical protein